MVRGTITDLCSIAQVKLPPQNLMFLDLIDYNLQREYKKQKAELLEIPEFAVKIRHRKHKEVPVRFLKRGPSNEPK
jgi:hypothetical protein